jgi:hypothetical protein
MNHSSLWCALSAVPVSPVRCPKYFAHICLALWGRPPAAAPMSTADLLSAAELLAGALGRQPTQYAWMLLLPAPDSSIRRAFQQKEIAWALGNIASRGAAEADLLFGSPGDVAGLALGLLSQQETPFSLAQELCHLLCYMALDSRRMLLTAGTSFPLIDH